MLTKIIKKLDLYYFFSGTKYIKRYFDITKCIYFDIKDEKLVDKHMKIYEKVNNIIKKKN